VSTGMLAAETNIARAARPLRMIGPFRLRVRTPQMAYP
jgi:hypothetical protein